MLELSQSEPWLRKLFDCCFCGMSGFLCLLPSFPEWNEDFSSIILPKHCNSLGACIGWCEPLGMSWGIIMPHIQSRGTCADHGCPCDFLKAQLWLYSLSSPLTLGWMEGEMSDLSDLSCSSLRKSSSRNLCYSAINSHFSVRLFLPSLPESTTYPSHRHPSSPGLRQTRGGCFTLRCQVVNWDARGMFACFIHQFG